MRCLVFLIILFSFKVAGLSQSKQSNDLFAKGVELYNQGNYHDAIPIFERVQQLDEAELDSTSTRLGYGKDWLASCYLNLGDTVRAGELNPWCFDINPLDRRLTIELDSLRQVAQAMEQSDINAAIAIYQQRAENFLKRFGETGMYAVMLTEVLKAQNSANLLGTYSFRQLLLKVKTIFEVQGCTNGLWYCYILDLWAQRMKAETFFQEAINVQQQQLAKLPKQTIQMHYYAWYRLCELYYQTQNIKQLRYAWKKLLVVTEQLYGFDNYAYANILADVSRFYYNLGCFQYALNLKEKLISLYVDLDNRWQADYQRIVQSLLLRDMNRKSEALLLLNDVLDQHSVMKSRDDTTFTIMALSAKATIIEKQYDEILHIWDVVESLLSENVNVYSLFYLFQHEGADYSNEILNQISRQTTRGDIRNLMFPMLTFATSMGAHRFTEATEQLRVVCNNYVKDVQYLSQSDLSITYNILSSFFEVNKKIGLSENLDLLPSNLRPDSLIYQNQRAITVAREMEFYTAELLYGIESVECSSAFYNFQMGCYATHDYFRFIRICKQYLERMKRANNDIATKNYDEVLQGLFLFYDVLRLEEKKNEVLREILRVEQILYGDNTSKYFYAVQSNLHKLCDVDSIDIDNHSVNEMFVVADNFRAKGAYDKAISLYKILFGNVSWQPEYMNLKGTDGGRLAFNLALSMKEYGCCQNYIVQTFDSLLLVNRKHNDYLNIVCNTLDNVTIALDSYEIIKLADKVFLRDDSLWKHNPELKGIIRLNAMIERSSFFSKERDTGYIQYMISETNKIINEVKFQYGLESINYKNFIIYATTCLMLWNRLDDINHINPSDIPDLIQESIRVHKIQNYTASETYRHLLYWQIQIEYEIGNFEEVIRLEEQMNSLPDKLERNPIISDNIYNSNYATVFSFPEENYVKKHVSQILTSCYKQIGSYDLSEEYIIKSMRYDLMEIVKMLKDVGMSMSEIIFYEKSSQLQKKAVSNALMYKNSRFCGFAYDVTLFIKGLLLRSQIEKERTLLNSANESLITLSNDLNNIREKLSNKLSVSIRDSLNKEEERLNALIQLSVNDMGGYARLFNISWKDISGVLKTDQVAIEFVQAMSPDDGVPCIVALFLKHGSEPKHVILCTEEELLLAMNDRQRQYELIWKPLRQNLLGIKTIFFSASWALHILPIESLRQPNGDVMCDIYNMYRLSSTLELLREKANSKPVQVALFGGVEYELSSEQWKTISSSIPSAELATRDTISFQQVFERGASVYLPGTEIEVGDIDRLLQDKGIKASLFTGIDATEGAVKQLSGSLTTIIHIATHGFFQSNASSEYTGYSNKNESIEMQSLTKNGLLMAGALSNLHDMRIPNNVDDGILTARELANLNLSKTELVTLSACETGLGNITTDGVFGLQRGFKKAGVNSILMSLWKVDDEATCLLMTEFYKNWIGQGKTKRESLELAKQTVRSHKEKGWNAPKYWAAFILLDGLD